MSDEQIGASFETDGLPVIKRAYSLKAVKQPKEASKVSVIHLVNSLAVFCLPVLYWLFRLDFTLLSLTIGKGLAGFIIN